MARKMVTPDELEVRAEANGYQRGAYREEGSRRDCNKHEDKTKKFQDATLGHHVMQESVVYTLKRSTLKWNISWHYLAMKEDALQKGLPVLNQALRHPDLVTVKDFFRFCAATGKDKIVTKITCDALHRGCRVVFRQLHQTNEDRRSEVHSASIIHHP
jgi:hypothetical protein